MREEGNEKEGIGMGDGEGGKWTRGKKGMEEEGVGQETENRRKEQTDTSEISFSAFKIP